jgi:hypothetical protein
MARKKRILSALVTYRASAKNPDTNETDVWEVRFVGNYRPDKEEWLRMAYSAGFSDISLTKVKKDK